MINAIKYMDDLIETGFTQEQSKTTVSMWMELMNENLATKEELKALELRLQGEMKDMQLAIISKLGRIIIASVTLLGIVLKFS